MTERSDLLLEALDFEPQGSLLSSERLHSVKRFSHAVDCINDQKAIEVLRGLLNLFGQGMVHLVVKGFGRVSNRLLFLLLLELLVGGDV